MIAGRYDLGADPELFAKPRLYAKFLATEDRYVWQNELLVVMPNGYGLYKLHGLPPSDVRAIAGLTKPGGGLGPATVQAIRALAARRSISLETDGGFPDWAIAALAGVAAVVAAGIAMTVVARRR